MRIRNIFLAATVLATSLLAATAARAGGPSNYTAILNAGQEAPANGSAAFGVAFFTFDKATGMLCASITTTALLGTETATHIHGPAAPGVNAAVLFSLPTGNPKSACVGPLDKVQATSLRKSLLYVNVHSNISPAGEIRGQIVPSAK